MKQIKEVLRLRFQQGLSYRNVADSLGISKSSVLNTLNRFSESGISRKTWNDLKEEELLQKLYPEETTTNLRGLPDFRSIYNELKTTKGLTLHQLWKEYKTENPNGYQRAQFFHHYRNWKKSLHPVMRQEHKAGEKAFVDWSGDGVPIVNPETGEVTEYPLFVGVLGGSGYTFAMVTEDRSLPNWITAHEQMYRHFQGVPRITVPDNDKSAVLIADRYEPHLNQTYLDMARHYGTAIIPARVRKPKDKAKVENAVLNMQRMILGKLRKHLFTSIKEANQVIQEHLTLFNVEEYQGLAVSRYDLWHQVDLPQLQGLPTTGYEFGEWSRAKVHPDYHVQVQKNYYSVPFALVGKSMDVRLTQHTVELFHEGQRVASHKRLSGQRGNSTQKHHMPEKHRQMAQWTPERLQQWATKIGIHTLSLVTEILASRPHEEQAFRVCMGIMKLEKKYGKERLEKACARTLYLRSLSYKSVQNILKNGLEDQPLPDTCRSQPVLEHENIRGAANYQ